MQNTTVVSIIVLLPLKLLHYGRMEMRKLLLLMPLLISKVVFPSLDLQLRFKSSTHKPAVKALDVLSRPLDSISRAVTQVDCTVDPDPRLLRA